MDINIISSIAKKFDGEIKNLRPFREPHSSSSVAAMVGGGKNANPGEITMAHHGVLFLDELPEFSRTVLDSLRQPLENRCITISRANNHVTYPSDFQLIAAMNPCRCGYLGNLHRSCSRAPKCGMDYQNKISGPILDRIDIHVEVSNINIMAIDSYKLSESTSVVKNRVVAARKVQEERYYKYGFTCNAKVNGEAFEMFLTPDQAGKDLLEKTLNDHYISVRGYTRILKVARTIADLEHLTTINKHHIMEALNYRLS